MRRNKGDITYYLTKDNDTYHLIKKRKIYAKQATQGKTKTTKQTVSNFIFKKDDFNKIDFECNGLRICDFMIIKDMLEQFENKKI